MRIYRFVKWRLEEAQVGDGTNIKRASGMAKRIADKELTDRNWDQEEEGEEAGTFLVASEDVLKSRAIKKAKRRNTGGEGESGAAFKGFKGFSLTTAAPVATPASTPAPFPGFTNSGGFKGFGSLTNGDSSTPSFGSFSSPASSSAASGLMFNGPSSTKPGASGSSPSAPAVAMAPVAGQTNGSAPLPSPAPGGHREYSRQLTALNCSVRDWITKHVNDNPLCDLNPIFRDYERHLATIERQYGAGSPLPPPSSSSSGGPALFSFSKNQDSAPKAPGVTFNFGQKVDKSALPSFPSSSSSSSSSSSASHASLFGAPGPAAPLAFGGAKTEVAQPEADKNEDEESEEPPKPEVKEVKEDDAFYSKKCKMFYKKESEFKDKGVGTLHLKNTSEGKTQMIIRADTNLGNILLNIIVPPAMPCSRVGKNNVMVVCVPNPPLDEKSPSSPVSLLIRVKTGQDADELHKILEEKKG
ncbi:unnamed protein product [Menidia menidia]|uniref:Nuclear pore complex protein Nup50 n=1 Tax=Menidia menidia TaxID=238744 RepID=A0A8S4AZJ2_9TELE|nr:unnamed protein product [Menidia menidia]